MTEQSNPVHDELDRLLGVEKPADPKNLAKEHGVLELPPIEHMNDASAELARVLVRVKAAPADRQVPALLAGLSDMVRAARKEGPAIVEHLATELKAGAVELLAEVMKGQPK